MGWFKRFGGWVAAVLLWLWTTLPKALDWVGRTTLPDDWEQLMTDKLPVWAAWLFSTPWWVPAILATALTGWMMWVSWPRQSAAHVVHHPPDSADVIRARAKLAREERLLKTVVRSDGADTAQLTLTVDDGNFRTPEAKNIHDVTVFPIGIDLLELKLKRLLPNTKSTKQETSHLRDILIHVIYAAPIADPLITVQAKNESANTRYHVCNQTSLYCAIEIKNIELPNTVSISAVARKKGLV